jgi:coat protein Gp5
MALLTAKGISGVAIELLVRRLNLARTVTLVPGGEFSGSNGDSITLRVPQPSAARTQASRGSALTADDLNEIPITVTMAHKYHLKNISDQELTFDIEDFARQITRPQVEAVALGVEQTLLDVMNALPATDATVNWDATPTEADDKDTILRARKFLNDNDAPTTERTLAVASDIAMRLLKYDFLSRVDAAGSTQALREGFIGRVFGFDVLEVPGMNAGESCAYHKSGFALAARAPLAPRGASASSAATAQGVGLRQVFQYDPGTAQDQSLVSVFAGAAAVFEDGTGVNGTDEARFCKIVAGT